MRQGPLELWGGVECTINRVDDDFYDQCARSGHRQRVEADLELFAAVGLRTLRTGVLWEHTAAYGWEFADRSLMKMRSLRLRPIVGLLHHGSGPPETDLLDPTFPEKLSQYAAQVARRFPWVTDYTPVNEPQTTARFSCLYRHWYPHFASMRSYLRALANQVKGIVLAMEAVRSVQPDARLVHTEDGGSTFSSPALEAFRIEREHRRWLGMDLLCGRLTRGHPLFSFLVAHGLGEAELLWFAEHPCPPATVGINYYVTSDRYLDDRTYLYPRPWTGGDFGDEPLVDTEAVRVRPQGIVGSEGLLMECWERYGIPVAVTEAHLGCTAEEQVRWLVDVWRGAEQARRRGAQVQAVTAWGLLGLYDWCSLCTRRDDTYEPGVFDVSSGAPAATELTQVVEQLATGLEPEHPALARSGWWREDSRLTIPPPMKHDQSEPAEEPALQV